MLWVFPSLQVLLDRGLVISWFADILGLRACVHLYQRDTA